MTASVNWINAEKTIIDINLGTNWQWVDFDPVIQQAYAMIREVPHKVQVIIHDNEPNKPLPQGSAMKHIRHALKVVPENVDAFAVQANDMVTKVFISVVTRISKTFRDRIIVVPSMEAGIDMLDRRNRAKA